MWDLRGGSEAWGQSCRVGRVWVHWHPRCTVRKSPSLKVWEMYSTEESLFKSMGASAPTMYSTEESLFKSMGASATTMYRTGESLFKSMGAWAPMKFNKGGCEKSFENHGCQGTHDVRTVSFFGRCSSATGIPVLKIF